MRRYFKDVIEFKKYIEWDILYEADLDLMHAVKYWRATVRAFDAGSTDKLELEGSYNSCTYNVIKACEEVAKARLTACNESDCDAFYKKAMAYVNLMAQECDSRVK